MTPPTLPPPLTWHTSQAVVQGLQANLAAWRERSDRTDPHHTAKCIGRLRRRRVQLEELWVAPLKLVYLMFPFWAEVGVKSVFKVKGLLGPLQLKGRPRVRCMALHGVARHPPDQTGGFVCVCVCVCQPL